MVGASGTPCAMSLWFNLGAEGLRCLGLGDGVSSGRSEVLGLGGWGVQYRSRPLHCFRRSSGPLARPCAAYRTTSESGLRVHHPRVAPAAKEL
jgi:hypothetical protein